MSGSGEFRCVIVRKAADGTTTAEIEQRTLDDLPPGDVLIRVRASSLNYKDALAVNGHPGIVRTFPHVPGIDAWGTVEYSESPNFITGQEVLTTGHELGVERWGGWSELIRVPADWVLPLPQNMTGQEAMQLGTAGFTAAQCVAALQRNGIRPDAGELVVTGATGGVATSSIMLLSQLGYRVLAVTGKIERTEWLKRLGAAIVADRRCLDESPRPLLSACYAGGIDSVGGPMLATLIKKTSQRGCIAACGVAGGSELPLTVYPFILRGVTLAGIESAWCPMSERREIWGRLATNWKLARLSEVSRSIPLEQAVATARSMLAGQTTGRTIIDMS